jgi:hypothetical protein
MAGALLTPWQVAGYAFALAVYAVAWTWGGRPERFAAGVMIIDLMVTSLTFSWTIDGVYLPILVQDCVRLLIFGWLCFRSTRWWPLVVATAIGQMIFVHVAQLLNPAMTNYAVASALVGLGYLVDLTLLFGVLERRLAGEPPAGPAAWAKAAGHRTAARRQSAGKAWVS